MADKKPLTRSTPEAEGISSAAILDFVRALEEHEHPLDAVQGFMLLRHGKVAAEGWWAPYAPPCPHSLYSLSKSFASTAIGIAVDEGLLTVDDPVLKFFPDEAPPRADENLQAMRVRHLLSMNTGHKEDTTGHVFRGKDDDWARVFLSLPVDYPPGTWFVYNTGATYMLSAILTKLTGETLLDYLRPRLFEPLGIVSPVWEADPRGISLGGTGLHITLEDIARFGQMYLQKGMWEGQRIVSEDWIAEATSAHSDNSNTQSNPDWTVGYGYQFWRCRHGAYRGDGAFGQYCIVMPQQEAVLAIISGVRNLQAVLDKVWEHLLPALQANMVASDSSAEELRRKLTSLSLPLVQGKSSSPQASQWAGKTYKLEDNALGLQSIALNFAEEISTLIACNERGRHEVQIGYDAWLRGTTELRRPVAEPVAACGAWTANDTYEVRVCYYESEVGQVLRFRFADDELHLQIEPNVSWESTKVTMIMGHCAE